MQWRSLSAEEKAPYEQSAKEDRDRYLDECAVSSSALPLRFPRTTLVTSSVFFFSVAVLFFVLQLRDEEVAAQQEERRRSNAIGEETESRIRGSTVGHPTSCFTYFLISGLVTHLLLLYSISNCALFRCAKRTSLPAKRHPSACMWSARSSRIEPPPAARYAELGPLEPSLFSQHHLNGMFLYSLLSFLQAKEEKESRIDAQHERVKDARALQAENRYDVECTVITALCW